MSTFVHILCNTCADTGWYMYTEDCPLQTRSQCPEHVLQFCPLFKPGYQSLLVTFGDQMFDLLVEDFTRMPGELPQATRVFLVKFM